MNVDNDDADNDGVDNDDSGDDGDGVNDLFDEDYTPSESPSTVAVISAAKASPLLNLSSDDVNNLSNSDVATMCDSDPGLLFIQRMIQNTGISSIDRPETTAVKAELQQLAEEVRNTRRALAAAEGNVEDLLSPGRPSVWM
jgi:hypothetical protein